MTHKSYMCIVWNGRNWYSSTLSVAFDCCAQQQRVTSLPLWNMPLPRSFIWLFTIMFESNISSLARYLQIQLFSVEENVTHGDESCTRKRCYVTKDFLVIPQNWKGLCAKYLQHEYGRESAVLDAYLMNPSTKDLTRMQWNKGCIGPEIHFTPDMTCTFSKEVFMPIKKLQLIHMPSYSQSAECCDLWCSVYYTITFAKQYNVLVVDDTDLVLLCA